MDCLFPPLKRCDSQMQYNSHGSLESHWNSGKSADRLSELPDDILVCILSRFKLKEAARTSVLSRRWRNLWTWSTGTLDFQYSEPGPDFHDLLDFSFGRSKLQGSFNVGRNELVKWVNHVVCLHKGSDIDEFQVSSRLLGKIRKETIDKWIKFALGKRVKRLMLDFTTTLSRGKGYSLMKPLLCKYNLDALLVLSLCSIDVTSKAIRHVLVKCPFLESLHVEKSSSLEELKVCGPLQRLKSLKIINCCRLKFIKISTKGIECFAYHGRNIPITFKHVPRLVEVSLGGCYASYILNNIAEFSSHISHVESLKLKLSTHSKFLDGVLPDLPVLGKLRILALNLEAFGVTRSINYCASLLKNCPILQRLSLQVSSPVWASDYGQRSSTCLHSSLRVLEIKSFRAFEREAEIYCYIVRCLPSLDQVILRPFCSTRKKHTFAEQPIDIAKKLEIILPQRTELIILS